MPGQYRNPEHMSPILDVDIHHEKQFHNWGMKICYIIVLLYDVCK